MKKFLIFFVSVLLLLIAAAAVFFITFDANRYKGFFTESLSKALGKPVTLGHVSLQWTNGAAIELSKLEVLSSGGESSTPGLALESASLRIKLLPLLQKNIQITSIILSKPFIDIVRERDGAIRVAGIDLAQKNAPSNPSGESSQGAAPVNFPLVIEAVSIRGGRILFHDLAAAAPKTIEIKDLDVNVKNFSLTTPFTFDATAALFSQKQNIKVSGGMSLPSNSNTEAAVTNLSMTTDLASFDLQQITEIFPEVKSAGIKGGLQGNLDVESQKISLDPKMMDQADIKIGMKNGKIGLAALNSPIEKIDALVTAKGRQITIDHVTANAAGGVFDFSGNISREKIEPIFNVKGSVKDLPLGQLVKNINPQAPQLSGHLNLLIEGSGKGLGWDSISKTINGRARIMIQDGVLLNYNILKEIIDKISVIPGAGEALQANFPQAYALRLRDKSTLLKPVDLNADIVNGIFNFNSLRVDTDFVLIDGAGSIGLDKNLNAQANVILNQEISQAAVRGFSQFQLLCNNRGEMVIPITAQGLLPHIRIIPDTNYITSKLLAGATQEIIGQLIKEPGNNLESIENILKNKLKGLNI